MNLANLRRSQRIEIAAAEMIVVRADDYVFVGLSRKPSEHVVYGRVRGFDVDVKSDVQVFRKGERRRLRAAVDLVLHFFHRFSGGLKPGIRRRILDLQHFNANVFRSTDAAKASQQVFFTVPQYSIDDDERLRAMIARVDGLGDELRMLRKSLMLTSF